MAWGSKLPLLSRLFLPHLCQAGRVTWANPHPARLQDTARAPMWDSDSVLRPHTTVQSTSGTLQFVFKHQRFCVHSVCQKTWVDWDLNFREDEVLNLKILELALCNVFMLLFHCWKLLALLQLRQFKTRMDLRTVTLGCALNLMSYLIRTLSRC